MTASSRITPLTVPLFSSDYARRDREIAEWNRRARPSFASIEAEFHRLQEFIDSVASSVPSSIGIATSVSYGTVKTDLTVPAPVVYLKTTVDALVAGLQMQITTLIAWQTPQQGSGDPFSQVPVPTGRFVGDRYWDTSISPPGKWDWLNGEWQA